MKQTRYRTPRFSALLIVTASAAFLVACGASTPAPELVAARNAYSEAKKGPAADMAPARLEEARQALKEAEREFEEDRKSEEAKTAAYIAVRRAEIATLRGNERKHEQKLKELKKKYDELERKRLNMTQEQLEAARAGLQETKQELSKKEEELSEKREELTEKQKALQKEREARKAAESRLEAAVASLKEMAAVKEEARGVVITLSGAVLFATGEHKLLPIAKEKLNEVAQALIDQGYGKIIVEGHTDSQGSESFNEELSLKRANAVRSHLVSQGIEADKIVAKGLGESRPVATNRTPEGRANNRRVEIIVEGEGSASEVGAANTQ